MSGADARGADRRERLADKMEYIHLIKLLYQADRESPGKYGAPIIGDRYVSMNKGPVLRFEPGRAAQREG